MADGTGGVANLWLSTLAVNTAGQICGGQLHSSIQPCSDAGSICLANSGGRLRRRSLSWSAPFQQSARSRRRLHFVWTPSGDVDVPNSRGQLWRTSLRRSTPAVGVWTPGVDVDVALEVDMSRTPELSARPSLSDPSSPHKLRDHNTGFPFSTNFRPTPSWEANFAPQNTIA